MARFGEEGGKGHAWEMRDREGAAEKGGGKKTETENREGRSVVWDLFLHLLRRRTHSARRSKGPEKRLGGRRPWMEEPGERRPRRGGQVYVGTSVPLQILGGPATVCVCVCGRGRARRSEGEGLQGRARPRVDRGREAVFPRCGKKGTFFLLPFLLYKGGAPHGKAGWAKEE